MISRLIRSKESAYFKTSATHALRPVLSRNFSPTCRVWVLACSMLVGCGGNDKGKGEGHEGSCYIKVGVSGGVNYEQTDGDLFCLYPTSFTAGISAIFIPYDEPFSSITLKVDEIMIDEVGTFPASLTFSHQDGRSFRSEDCEVSVDTHEPDGEDSEDALSYHFSGSGSCALPAVSPDDPADTLTISNFEFAAGVVWQQ